MQTPAKITSNAFHNLTKQISDELHSEVEKVVQQIRDKYKLEKSVLIGLKELDFGYEANEMVGYLESNS